MNLNDVTVIMKCIGNFHVIFNCFQWNSFVQLWNLPTNYDLDNDKTYFFFRSSVRQANRTADSRSPSKFLTSKISSKKKKFHFNCETIQETFNIYNQIHNDSLINRGSSTNNTATSNLLITFVLMIISVHNQTKDKFLVENVK